MILPDYFDYRPPDNELVLKAVNAIPCKEFYEIVSLILNKETLQALTHNHPANRIMWQHVLTATILATPDGTDYEKLDLLNALCKNA